MTYQIVGAPFPVVICSLDAGESVFCQTGAMAWMSDTIGMRTGAGQGGIGGMFSRLMTGEGLFQNEYTALSRPGTIAFRADAPGEILALPMDPRRAIIAQKGAYLASEPGVSIEAAVQGLGAGLFGGEGFVLQRFSGRGLVFLAIDGTVVDDTLAPGESLLMDTGTFAAAEETVRCSVERVGARPGGSLTEGLGNMIAGGEGIFNTRVTGPGKIWMQTMPRKR